MWLFLFRLTAIRLANYANKYLKLALKYAH